MTDQQTNNAPGEPESLKTQALLAGAHMVQVRPSSLPFSPNSLPLPLPAPCHAVGLDDLNGLDGVIGGVVIGVCGWRCLSEWVVDCGGLRTVGYCTGQTYLRAHQWFPRLRLGHLPLCGSKSLL